MSAGGLSYSGLVNYGASTLPSVESWGNNMNILRDPPKSIHTRRITKVGETSSITEMVDESGDRTAETILVYPRGINPMVGVSYSNYGNNGGGGQAGSLTGLSQSFTNLSTANTQSFLPYRTAVDGAFRPPVKSQTELLPLSRMPRVWTSQATTPGFVDYTKRMRDCGDSSNTREVQTDNIKTFIRPTHYNKVEKPLEKPLETKYNIQKIMNLQGNSGIRTLDYTEQYVGNPNEGIVQKQPLHVDAIANIGDSRNFVYNIEVDPSNFIQDTNIHNVDSNTSGLGQTNIEEIMDIDTTKYIQDIHNINYKTQQSSSGDGTTYIHDNLKRERVLPNYQAETNIANTRIHKYNLSNNDITLKQNKPNAVIDNNTYIKRIDDSQKASFHLNKKISPGEYLGNNGSSKPSDNRITETPTLKQSNKNNLFKSMNEQQYSR